MDDDTREVYQILKEEDKARKARNLAAADPTGWVQRTRYHWQREVGGDIVDYWPSRNKWRYKGRTHVGEITGWLRKLERQIS